MTIRLKAELSDGRVFIGPVKGCGGFLGNGALHAGREKAAKAALNEIRRASAIADELRPHGYVEPKPGHVAMCPEFSYMGNGPVVEIPLFGTKWSVAY